ncbi:lipocalin family protein [Alteraurantiacibacter aquimixticola]|uniref:Uncharacterized protein n=1 Tax=Alteraurantiacibacter aquimixticola TaxID=2489173 RepID=A0A4T3F600_9SPHN|nr:lipocalin family protein [Alteraurantiacibacter aquimixticola]TIX51824.1 hypothetical protein E5222_05105 [Alteraurantiacibacter aquimixticola]
MRRFFFLVVAAATSMFCAAPSFAQALPARDIEFRAQLVPASVTLTEPDGWYDERERFVDVPLQPKKAYVLDEELKTSDENVFLPSGTQMVSMRSRYSILCSHVETEAGFLNPLRRVCVGDFDRDGSYERAWQFSSGQPVWEFSARVPVAPLSISSPSLVPISPDDLANLPRLEIYSDHMALRRRPRDGSPPYWEAFVRVRITGPDGGRSFFCLTQQGYCVGYRTNTLLGLGNMVMRVIDVQDEMIRLEILSNFRGEELQDLMN